MLDNKISKLELHNLFIRHQGVIKLIFLATHDTVIMSDSNAKKQIGNAIRRFSWNLYYDISESAKKIIGPEKIKIKDGSWKVGNKKGTDLGLCRHHPEPISNLMKSLSKTRTLEESFNLLLQKGKVAIITKEEHRLFHQDKLKENIAVNK